LSKELYIPHGSDESWNHFSSYCIKDKLYIPHGSDERHGPPHALLIFLVFISHMVQMKEMGYPQSRENA